LIYAAGLTVTDVLSQALISWLSALLYRNLWKPGVGFLDPSPSIPIFAYKGNYKFNTNNSTHFTVCIMSFLPYFI
jgi:hypothetical protein